MKKFFSAAIAVAAAVSFLPAASHADPPGAAGFTCGFESSDDPTGTVANPGTQVGEQHAGPVLVADVHLNGFPSGTPSVDPTGNPASGTITCDIQVGGTGVYTDPNAASSSASGIVLVILPPSLISYAATALDPIWECTTWTLTDANGDSTTLYLDDVSGAFMTDPAAATCALAVSQSGP